jgi:hypothetical protein
MHMRARLSGRSTSSALACSLVCVLLCVPSLTRAVDRTPINKENTGFKFSKTLELPHKKAGSVPAATIRTEPVVLDARISEFAAPVDIVTVCLVGARRPASSRAPPPASPL